MARQSRPTAQCAAVAASPNPPLLPCGPRHTAGMALRFTVQGDDEHETAAGLELLLSLGLAVRMPPRRVSGDRWMARAVPGRTNAPAEDDGRGAELSG